MGTSLLREWQREKKIYILASRRYKQNMAKKRAKQWPENPAINIEKVLQRDFTGECGQIFFSSFTANYSLTRAQSDNFFEFLRCQNP